MHFFFRSQTFNTTARRRIFIHKAKKKPNKQPFIVQRRCLHSFTRLERITGAVPHGQNSTSCQRIHASSLFTEPWHWSYMAAASRMAQFVLLGIIESHIDSSSTPRSCCRPADQLLNVTLGAFMLREFPVKNKTGRGEGGRGGKGLQSSHPPAGQGVSTQTSIALIAR